MSVRILIGDVRERLAELPSDSFDCVVTSPPYWGLRDYGTARWEGGDPACDHRSPTMREGRTEDRAKLPGSAATNSAQLLLAHRSACGLCGATKVDAQIGLEATLGEHLDVMVGVMREVRRVLKPTGTLWLNYGDCYATSPGGRVEAGGVLKPKDLCMVPNRLAIALQEDGWWVRSEIIWAKPNPMPESINDRPATAHEKVFLLSKAARYHYDADAVRQGRAQDEDANGFRGGSYVGGKPGPRTTTGNKRQNAIAAAAGDSSSSRRMAGFNERWADRQYLQPYTGQSQKDYAAQGVQDPSDIKRRIVEGKMAGTIPDGRNLRNYEPAPVEVWNVATRSFSEAHFATFPPELAERCLRAGCPAGGSVLDPFGGAGTTALVADRLGLDCALIELNPEYAEITERRLRSDAGLFDSTRVVPTPCPGSTGGVPEIDRSGDRTRAGDSRPKLGMGGEGRAG